MARSPYSHPPRKKRRIPMERLIVGSALGYGMEGIVHEADAVMVNPKKRGEPILRTRRYPLALKKFFQYTRTLDPNFRHPIRHVLNYEWLNQINREQKLGLNIIPTLRLVTSENKYTLLKTRLPALPIEGLSEKQKKEYHADARRQIKIMKSIGIKSIWKDLFFPYIDPKTQACKAIINDFGTLHPDHTLTPLTRFLTRPLIRKMVGMLIRHKVKK